MKKVDIGWDEYGTMLHTVDVKLEIGMRLVILGPNGAGKSTLMRAMAGRGGVLSGSREVGDGVEIGVFTQDLAQDLPGHLSALNFVLQVHLRLT
jgi:ATP-binding cassette subfamily F protein 3